MATNIGTIQRLALREYEGGCQFKTNYLRSLLDSATSLYRKDLFAHYGCVNAIEFSADGEWLASGGDDRRVLLWDMCKTLTLTSPPHIMKGEHNSNIFCISFDSTHSKVLSAGNDEQVIVHNIETGETLDVFMHEEAVYGLSVDPVNNSVFASACDNGQILIWDTRVPSTGDPLILAQSSSAFHAVVYNPSEPRLLATANSREGVALWDIRKPRLCLLHFGGCLSAQSSMSVRFSRGGLLLLALRRRLPPVLYNISSPCPVVEFDHPGYYNSCTMKSCTFAGDNDQYIMSGSDDFKLYMWKIPPESQEKKGLWVNQAHMVLKGHRSIVNQVRYSPATSLIASSGVEKTVKLWSLFPLSGGSGGLKTSNVSLQRSTPSVEPNGFQDPRRVYSHEEYINLVLESGQFMSHDYSHRSMNEDPRMMAFFDSLVQRDIEGWTSDSSDSTVSKPEDTEDIPCAEVQSLPSSSSPSFTLTSDSNSSDDELSLPAQDESMVPHTLSYITKLTNRVEVNLMNLQQQNNRTIQNTERDISGSDDVNRISQLIARKRHEQLLRAARSTVRQTQKRLKKTRSGTTFVRNANKVLDAEEKTLDGARKILDMVLLRQTQNQNQKDHRKALRKRRARLFRGLSDSSEHSSDDNEGSGMSSTVAVKLAISLKNDNLEASVTLNDGASTSVVNQNGMSVEQTPLVTSNSVPSEQPESSILKDSDASSSFSNVNTNGTSTSANSVSHRSASSFKLIKNKDCKRNYRSQNHQRDEDD